MALSPCSPGEDGAWPTGPGVHLVQNHVLELLVVNGSEVDVGFQGLPVGVEQSGEGQSQLLAPTAARPDSPGLCQA